MNPEEMYARRYLKEEYRLSHDPTAKKKKKKKKKILLRLLKIDGRIYISAKLKEVLSDNIITGKKKTIWSVISPGVWGI